MERAERIGSLIGAIDPIDPIDLIDGSCR